MIFFKIMIYIESYVLIITAKIVKKHGGNIFVRMFTLFLNYVCFKIVIYATTTTCTETSATGVAVKAIKRQHLVEIRSMANPPAVVKLALESICLLLEENATDWKQIRAVIMKDSFIPTIVNFNTEGIM